MNFCTKVYAPCDLLLIEHFVDNFVNNFFAFLVAYIKYFCIFAV